MKRTGSRFSQIHYDTVEEAPAYRSTEQRWSSTRKVAVMSDVAELRELLGAGDRDTRLKAVDALCEMGLDAIEAFPDLQRLLHDEDADLRTYAALGIGQLGSAAVDAVPDLLSLLRSP